MTFDEIIRRLQERARGSMPDQRSTTAQLEDLASVADRLGMYDASDSVRRLLARMKTPAE